MLTSDSLREFHNFTPSTGIDFHTALLECSKFVVGFCSVVQLYRNMSRVCQVQDHGDRPPHRDIVCPRSLCRTIDEAVRIILTGLFPPK